MNVTHIPKAFPKMIAWESQDTSSSLYSLLLPPELKKIAPAEWQLKLDTGTLGNDISEIWSDSTKIYLANDAEKQTGDHKVDVAIPCSGGK